MKKVEQITANQSLLFDYDDTLRRKSDFLDAFKLALGQNVYIEKFNTHSVYIYEHDNIKECILTGAITYLGVPHPLFKKRLQLKEWYKEYYELYKNDCNKKIRMIGVYHYQGLYLFVEFLFDDYINGTFNNSSAHVHTNDLFQGLIHGTFTKLDNQNNHVSVIKTSYLKEYILGKKTENSLFNLFTKFNKSFDFGKNILADVAIKDMRDGNFYQWRGTEWPGWYLEYKFSGFIVAENCENEMKYIGNIKSNDYLDFDIYFPEQKFYGDLKSSDIDKNETPANDQETVLNAINNFQRLWYVIYEHKTIKDSDMNHEMAIKRMKLIDESYQDGDHISYLDRMKYSVEFKQMKIFELNRINMSETLSAFNQGHQPDGKKRAPKFKINKKNIDNFTVYSYVYDN